MTEFWQDLVTGFGLGFAAYAATNLDNFLLLCGLIGGGARRRSVTVGFVTAGGLILLLALSFSVLSYLVSPAMLGYLGVVPIALGLRILIYDGVATEGTPQLAKGVFGVAALLTANSLDTVATFAPMFAESEAIVRFALVVGYIASAIVLITAVLRITRRLSRLAIKKSAAQKITGVVMILVGAYVLSDSGTDLE